MKHFNYTKAELKDATRENAENMLLGGTSIECVQHTFTQIDTNELEQIIEYLAKFLWIDNEEWGCYEL